MRFGFTACGHWLLTPKKKTSKEDTAQDHKMSSTGF